MKIFVGIFFLSCFHGLYAENECNDYQCEVLDPISYLEGALDWNKVGDVIEIGDHLGWSTRFLTNKLPLKSKIYLIGSEENEREILSNLGSQMSLNQVIFHSNDFIQEARKWSHRVSLIYFHVGIEEIYKNLKAWSPKVAVGGMMCGLSASSPLFLAQVKLFASQNQYSVKVKGDFWYLSPKKPSPFHRVRSCPWVVDHANDFLETFMENHPDARVLEFGSGSSTLWFAKRTPNLVSIEHQENWYELIQTYIETHDQYYPVEYYLHPLPYHSVCQKLPKESFDLIIVDGRNRKVCLRESISLLKPGGVLMLDNSERPYYHGAFSLFHGWKGQVFKQVGPDREGFHYPGWETRLWVKPELNPMRP